MRVAVIGAGWAGLSAAVQLTLAGADVSLFEMSRQPGGRARSLDARDDTDKGMVELDNGQHILIGAYRATLELMQSVGVRPADVLQRLPLSLPYPDGSGFTTPSWATQWPAPWGAIAAIITSRSWRLSDKWSLLATLRSWRANDFSCSPQATAAQVCQRVSQQVMQDLIDPLCVSALNLTPQQASGQVFLRVMRDAMLGQGFDAYAASDLLVPKVGLGCLLPTPALQWLDGRGTRIEGATQITHLLASPGHERTWTLASRLGEHRDWPAFDHVICATGASAAHKLVSQSLTQDHNRPARETMGAWASSVAGLQHTAIGTVYVDVPSSVTTLPAPMIALPCSGDPAKTPVQFVFDRTGLGYHSSRPHWAMVASNCMTDTSTLTTAALDQITQALGLPVRPTHIKTVIEKRATFACTPALVRPSPCIAPGLYAAGDYVEGPYPATLEGAVLSGKSAALACLDTHASQCRLEASGTFD
ncbi:hydroxysqualene dehydroxylase HpnE [Hydrogenophaga sp. 5NK40-0174]|uniref:hydroxysqualene dehydroxylase HpnE n=1 Tax=Hydrogenophaga sp. 5NK40-0174 TaxID=3127649 RepID=UPI00334101A4